MGSEVRNGDVEMSSRTFTDDAEATTGTRTDGAAAEELAVEPLNPQGTSESEGGGVEKSLKLLYAVDDVPPAHITVLYAFQQVVANIGGAIAQAFVICILLCEGNNQLLAAEILGSSLVIAGITSFLQVTLGVRVPAVQMSAKTFLGPIAAIMQMEQWKCRTEQDMNSTTWKSDNYTMEYEADNELLNNRIRVVSGCLASAAAVQVVLGFTGVFGALLSYVGPLTLAPAISLIALMFVPFCNMMASTNWGITFLTIALILLFSVILGNIKLPFPAWSNERGLHMERYQFFKLFPHILSAALCWVLCYILTVTDVLPEGSKARTDSKISSINQAPWILKAYPGKYGAPTFSAAGFVGMLAACVASILESVGDYYMTCRISGLSTPPAHAVNRGILMEGLGGLLAGFMGICHSVTTYSSTVGFIGLTGMASRRVWQVMSVILVLAGLCGKVGAVLSAIPDPVLAGVLLVSLSFVLSSALSNIQFLDLTSARNLVILGLSHMLGLMVPRWMRENQGALKTGSESVDLVVTVFLSLEMLVGGTVGFVLDNICPGTPEERGLLAFRTKASDVQDHRRPEASAFDLPYITPWLAKHGVFTYLPCSPTYISRDTRLFRRCRKKRAVGQERDGGVTERNTHM